MSAASVISPLMQHSPWGKRASSSSLLLFEAATGGNKKSDPRKSVSMLGETLRRHGVQQLFLPNVCPTKHIAHHRHFRPKTMGESFQTPLPVLNSAKAAGVRIENRGHAVGMFDMRVPVAVFKFPHGSAVVLACSEQSLLDRDIVLRRKLAIMPNLSIVGKILKDARGSLANVQVFITQGSNKGLHPQPQTAEVYEYVRARHFYVLKHFGSECLGDASIGEHLDLFNLLQRQCVKCGVPEGNISSLDLSSQKPSFLVYRL